MMESIRKGFVVYCSPCGTTRHVARVIENRMADLHGQVRTLDLGKERNWEPVLEEIRGAGNGACLFVGSPVYANHPVPPVMRFIQGLPENTGAFAVPFATWGRVTSGLALYDMAEALDRKGFQVVGAVKVLAVHSMMWDSDDPLGKGHPDGDDDRMVAEMVHKVDAKLKEKSPGGIDLSDLRYYPEEVCREMAQRSLEAVKSRMPKKTVDPKKCTECGICAEECPADAIRLAPLPEFTEDCFFCYACVQQCPEAALTVEKAHLDGYLRQRSAEVNETTGTRYFV